MFLDAQTQLSSAQALTATAVSTNTLDLGAVPSNGTANGAARDPSLGEPLGIVVATTVAADHTTGNETYSVQVIQSANADLSSPDVLAEIAFTDAQAAAELIAGAVIVATLPKSRISKRYIGANYVLAGTTPTWTVTAWVAPLSMIQNQKYYTSAIVVN